MKTRTALGVMVAVGIGCGDRAPAEQTECAAAATVIVQDEQQQRAARSVVIEQCRDHEWSKAALTCFSTAKTAIDKTTCVRDHLSGTQIAALELALDNLRPEPPASEIEARLAVLAKHAEDTCACRDAACMQRVSEALARATLGFDRRYRRTLSGAAKERAAKIGERLSSCGQQVIAAGSAPSAAERYVAKNAEFKKRICACKDLVCGEAAAKELTTWAEQFLSTIPETERMSSDDEARMEAIERDVHACLRALRDAAKQTL